MAFSKSVNSLTSRTPTRAESAEPPSLSPLAISEAQSQLFNSFAMSGGAPISPGQNSPLKETAPISRGNDSVSTVKPSTAQSTSTWRTSQAGSKDGQRGKRESRPLLSLSRRSTSAKDKIAKSSAPTPTSFPRNPSFSFATSGSSLLFWGDEMRCVMRFEFLSNVSMTQSCRYDVAGVQAAAAGDDRCAVVTADGKVRCAQSSPFRRDCQPVDRWIQHSSY